jgi:Spy/CpxP family protein refolding chaperone
MSLRRILTGASLMLGLVFTLSAVAVAQQTSTTPQDNGQGQQERWGRKDGRHGMGKRGRGRIERLASQLNLTDDQQQQLRAIEERYKASTRTQREEMHRLRESSQGEQPSADVEARFQALRAEIGQSMRAQHQEMLGVLTPEQRTQLEQLMKERKARRGERRGRRMEQQNNDDDQ